MTTGYVWHELYGWHDTAAGLQPSRHFESAESKKRLHELLAVSGLPDRLERPPVEPATEEQLRLAHEPGYIERIRAESRLPKGGDAGTGSRRSGRVASRSRLAAGGAIAAVTAVAEGRVGNAYALVRPPGHHALPGLGMGFCIFANIAVAVRRRRSSPATPTSSPSPSIRTTSSRPIPAT